ncbi:MAP kinase kinase 1 interacting protein (macronuclear) [Tetrahymena thermophila SB210]|uniref:MAP kinase kinase 1 interacting protein n=1 Tax=Tetrahymena thermophila (strain SB210) TaxID=312017 RepID=I7M612_TETTS|nr:MAP kinase kinase 1 interacting protein [Tetrahymena thermophila SB210]EAR84007.2 MAP kinase kinase 1 interacting protein [Tetrahymena thermophila SB210]|eukprot:XP_001031670.2 MAP kinase kinase 1 interacting protein [Tetrahymena thermophila SB210]
MSELNNFLKKYIEKFDFINAIVLTDKEEIQVCASYRQDEEKYNSAAQMLSTFITQRNEHLQKLNNTKAKAITFMYTDHLIYMELWENLKICMFCVKDANLPFINKIVEDMKESLSQLNKAIENIKN